VEMDSDSRRRQRKHIQEGWSHPLLSVGFQNHGWGPTKSCRTRQTIESTRLMRSGWTRALRANGRKYRGASENEATDLSANATAEIPATTTMVRTRTLIRSLM
jgi:hypothetical protein